MYALAFQKVIIEAILDIFYFPIWWYSLGLVKAGRWCLGFLQGGAEMFAPGVWIKNVFVPMYGQYDWEGRIISFFMRVFQIIVRSVAMVIWLWITLVIFFGYLAIPLFIINGFYSGYTGYNLINMSPYYSWLNIWNQ
jgi:hypothetical protein